MSVKDTVSPEQWKALINAPGAAAAYVSTASGGVLEMFKETFTAGKFIQESLSKAGGSGYGAVVDELLAAMKGMSFEDKKASSYQYQAKDQAGLRAEAKQVVADAGAAVTPLPEGDGYKRWILDIARQVALTKTGGVLGFGAKSVIDEQEQVAMDELAAMLGVK